MTNPYSDPSINTPVAGLVKAIKRECQKRKLKFSRWQSSSNYYTVVIIYAVHKGKRTRKFKYMDEQDLVDFVYLHNHEGKTSKCEAYRKLLKMLLGILENDK